MIDLTRDHKPGEIKEWMRIESNGGEVRKSQNDYGKNVV